MDDQNTQNFTPTTDLTDPVTDDSLASQLTQATQDTPQDFPTITPSQGPAESSPNSSMIQTTHPTYTPGDSMSDTSSPTTSTLTDTDPPQDQDLISIKKNALQQLTPLVGHLEQSPEEKFKTILMMIQASDDKSMISNAYDAAQQITDDKLKAQALLDIVNEINYFTQQNENQ
jgi:hypothetical protein